LSVYPNPAKNELYIDLTDLSLSTTLIVSNLVGQQLMFKQLTSTHNPLDISILDAGIYTFEVRQGNNGAVRQVVVTK
jgi:hypothetical protein